MVLYTTSTVVDSHILTHAYNTICNVLHTNEICIGNILDALIKSDIIIVSGPIMYKYLLLYRPITSALPHIYKGKISVQAN